MILANTVLHSTGRPAGTAFPEPFCQSCNKRDWVLEWWNRHPQPAPRDTFGKADDEDLDRIHNLDGKGPGWAHSLLRALYGRGKRKESTHGKDALNVFDPPGWARRDKAKKAKKVRKP